MLIVNANTYAQSNKGTEFWTAFMAHNNGVTSSAPAEMVLYITSDISTSGSVEIGGAPFKTFTVTANQVTFVQIPTTAYMNGFGKFTNTGIHITSVAPIAVYAHIYAMNASGATLLLPVNAMGKDYLSLNYTQISNAPPTNPAYSTFDIIATEDNTTVAITPAAPLLDGSAANVTFNISLNKGQVYQVLANTDLTGSKIQSKSTNTGTCKKIAVFSGSTRIGIGCDYNIGNNFSSDNLFQQVYPTSTWGKNYIAAPLKARPYDVYRIILSDLATNVTLNGNPIPLTSFTNGLYYEFQSTIANNISADKPIQVVQYSPTQNQQLNCTVGNGDIGDPEMIYLSPIEQGLTHVTFYATGYYKILQSYVNVIMPTTGVSSFKLDGVDYSRNFVPIPNSTYSYAQLAISSGPQSNGNTASVTSGTHNLDAAVPFNAIAYGFGSTESYGYAAGANLQDFTESVSLENPLNATVAQAAGCSNVSYKAQVTIPYPTTSIAWYIDGVNVFTDNNPVIKSTTTGKDNKPLYVYEYSAPVNFTVGNHTIKATVFDPVADVCGSNQDIENDFTVTAPPPADFIVAPTDCLGDSTAFKDNTTYASGETASAWLWDFGDNTTSSLQNPLHKYASVGDYPVRLTVTDNNGCTDISAPKNVHVITKPVANFNPSSPDCPGQTITFTNTSTAADGTITTAVWDFGDKTPITTTNTQPVTHTYATPGNYMVKLVVTTDVGCTSDTLSKTVTVNPLPVASFTVPDVCLGDGFASFIDSSSIADHTETDFTYLWDFGDPNSSVTNNQSTLKNPKHAYLTVGKYTATLTVTSKYGCSATAQNTFTVNGSNPKAVFAPESTCSGDDIVFDDRSIVDAYNITKVVWYFDIKGQPNVAETYADAAIHADHKYTHKYPAFNTPAQQPIDVALVVYSGQTCKDSLIQTVYLNAKPLIGLSANNNTINTASVTPDTVTMCYADTPIQITENKGVYTGTGVFSGAGISSSGLFDPQKAGVGNSTINYLFTASSTGCTDSLTFVARVNPTPVINLPTAYTMLEGTELTLRPVVTIAGTGNLTYKWTPLTGLSADNVATPIANPSTDTQYALTVTSDKGCSTTIQTTVKVLKLPIVPNAFTPNGDGINDTWEIKYLDTYPNATVEVFNRYGTKVYYSNGYGVPWNGKSNGGDLPVGTYYYIINPNSGRKPLTGYLSIIR